MRFQVEVAKDRWGTVGAQENESIWILMWPMIGKCGIDGLAVLIDLGHVLMGGCLITTNVQLLKDSMITCDPS